MDENNQYGHAMTKPLPTGCDKQETYIPTVRHLRRSGTDGHLFMVDIEFDVENASSKQLFLNEIYPPIFEKKRVIAARDRSVYQLFSTIRMKDDATLNKYRCIAKTHSTLGKRFFIPLYAEHIKFLIERCCWKVTKVHRHFTFKQELFKKEFVIGNQITR